MGDVRPVILDGCCGAGLARDGLDAAGWDAEGYDIVEQPNYPGRFRRWDILQLLRTDIPSLYAGLFLAPPCQPQTRARHLRKAQGGVSKWPDVLTPTLALLRWRWNHLAWVVENVEDARTLMAPRRGEYLVRVCGAALGMPIQRHRLFLSNRPLTGTPCSKAIHHAAWEVDDITGRPKPWGVYHVPGDRVPQGGKTARDLDHARALFRVPADRPITWQELKEGYPPAYTELIGRQLLLGLDVDQALAAVPAGRVDPCDGCGQGVCACHEGK